MKKRIVIILIGAILGNMLSYLFFFPFLIKSLKERFDGESPELSEKMSQVIEIDSSDYKKIKFLEKNEFIYKGKLYDLLEQKKEGNKVLLLCYHDIEEENAINGNDDYMNKKNSENSFNFNFFYYTAVTQNAMPDSYSGSSSFTVKRMAFLYFSVVLEIPCPPPRIHC